MSSKLDVASAVLAKRAADFEAAAARVAVNAIDAPLLRAPKAEGREVRLKAENLQPGGSFKIRCATNIVEQLDPATLRGGIVTASAGNFAPSVAVAVARHGIPVTCHVPENSAAVKLAMLRELGVRIVAHPFERWWRIMETRDTGADEGLFLHPVCEVDGIVGNGTLSLELLETWPEVDTVVVPFGGGGLVSGIAAAMRATGAGARVYACEIEGASPLAAAFAVGHPVPFDRQRTFVNGPGKQSVLEVMWPLLRELLAGVIVVPEAEALAAYRRLALESHLVVESQSAIAYAAALSSQCPGHRIVAILSGGNIDQAALIRNLEEADRPQPA